MSSFSNLPAPVRGAAVLAAGGGITAALFAVGLPPIVMMVVVGGLVVVVLLVVLYACSLKWLKKRRARPMEQGVLKSTAGLPPVSDPERLARIDDLHKKFQAGIATFRTAGKSLYSLPWYVVAGEPGSGKTEAVRHCGIGFPPGLHDQFQGVGGTMNMNWWFTDHGVIIDTAGRLMFEEVETGRSSEWKEFLCLLRKYRPNCPINGAFLVIPVDSLIKDSSDEIERKAAKISQQFDVIQRTLDVRFPVYVVISKCDLITGFREFFANLDDPQLQHQILGWSNPAALDEPYNPQFVDQHVEAIRSQLFRRRLTRLQQLSSEHSDKEDRPTVEALYAFPHSLSQIAPRLTRYLDLIFSVGSQWSCKPLFFRGIYFTSSMQEGTALDEDLAASLGVSVDALPEGPVFRRDRAYFLRDLFMKKVFRERGLVTRASNASKQHRRRKVAVLLAAIASLVVLIVLTVIGSAQHRDRVGELEDYLAVAVPGHSRKTPGKYTVDGITIVETSNYTGAAPVSGASASDAQGLGSRYQYCARLVVEARACDSEGVPWYFRWFTKSGPIQGLNEALARTYYDSVVQPLLSQTGQEWDRLVKDLSTKPWPAEWGRWTPRDPHFQALQRMIQLKAGTAFDASLAGEYLDPLFRSAFFRKADREAYYRTYAEHKAQLNQPLEGLYVQSTGTPWPPETGDSRQIEATITNGITLFTTYWARPPYAASAGSDIEAARRFVRALKAFDAAGAEVANAYAGGLDCEAFAGEWARQFQRLEDAKTALDAEKSVALEAVALDARLADSSGPLTALWQQAADARRVDLESSYHTLLNTLQTADLGSDSFLKRCFEDVNDHLAQGNAALEPEEDLADLQKRYMSMGEGALAYERRFGIYAALNECFAFVPDITSVDELGDALDNAQSRTDAAATYLGASKGLSDYSAVVEMSNALLACANRRAHGAIARQGLALAERIRPQDYRGNPAAIEQFLQACDDVNDATVRSEDSTLIETYKRAVAAKREALVTTYLDYWLGEHLQGKIGERVLASLPGSQWPSVHQSFKRLSLRDELRQFKTGVAKPVSEHIARFETRPPASHAAQMVRFRAQYDGVEEYITSCREKRARWERLSPTALEARRDLLGLDAAIFQRDYVGAAPPWPAAFAEWYWRGLIEQTLTVLAGDVREQVRADVGQLAACRDKFPLKRGLRRQQELTDKELQAIQEVIRHVSPAGQYALGTIGRGSQTDDLKLNERLEAIRSCGLSQSDKEWLGQIKPIVACLPAQAGQTYYCRVILPGIDQRRERLEAGATPFSDIFTRLDVTPRPARAGQDDRRDTGETSDIVLATVAYPGPSEGVQMNFYTHPSDPTPRDGLTVPGPWACLRLLLGAIAPSDRPAQPTLEVVAEEGGYVKLVRDAEPETDMPRVVLRLKLEFYEEPGKVIVFPGVEAWPQ